MKKTLVTLTLATLLTLGGVSFANAGMLLSDRPSIDGGPTECKSLSHRSTAGIIIEGSAGIIIEGSAGIIIEGATGIIIEGATGIIIEGSASVDQPCGTSSTSTANTSTGIIIEG